MGKSKKENKAPARVAKGSKSRHAKHGNAKHRVARKPSSSLTLPAFQWKDVGILGDTNERINFVRSGIDRDGGGKIQYSFDEAELQELRLQNPDKSIFIFASAEDKDFSSDGIVKPGVQPLPVLNAILVPRGAQPPSFVALRNADDKVLPMSKFGFFWEATTKGWDNVFVLKSKRRTSKNSTDLVEDLSVNQHMVLFTMRSNDLVVDQVTIKYIVDGQEEDIVVDLVDSTFLTSLMDEFELDPKIHYEPLTQAIAAAAETARADKMAKMDLLLESGLGLATLDAIQVFKIYPQNEFVKDTHKSKFVNIYYPKAINQF